MTQAPTPGPLRTGKPWATARRLAPTAPAEASGSEREPVTHEVKCWREPFAALKSGAKPWELRLNDRDYRTGDTLRQFEWNEAENCYTGDEVSHRIGWLLKGPSFGLPDGYVVMTLEALRPQPSGETREADHASAISTIYSLTRESVTNFAAAAWNLASIQQICEAEMAALRPQPSGTRELLHQAVNLGHNTDEPTLRQMIEHYYRSHHMTDPMTWADRYVSALLSARPLGGQHSGGDHADAVEPLRRSIAELKRHIESVQAAKRDGGPGNTITDCINALPAIVRAMEVQIFVRWSVIKAARAALQQETQP